MIENQVFIPIWNKMKLVMHNVMIVSYKLISSSGGDLALWKSVKNNSGKSHFKNMRYQKPKNRDQCRFSASALSFETPMHETTAYFQTSQCIGK